MCICEIVCMLCVRRRSLFELDEGHPVIYDLTNDRYMKARIAHNLILYGGHDHIRLKNNPNVEVHNNAIMAAEGRHYPTPEGITSKDSQGIIRNLTMHSNIVHSFAAPLDYHDSGGSCFDVTGQFVAKVNRRAGFMMYDERSL